MALEVGMRVALRPKARTASWDGTESPWVSAARAAAPWPIWSLIALAAARAAPWSGGVLGLAFAFGLMVAWLHRPPARRTLRWLLPVLGTGLMGELLTGALTDMGRTTGLAERSDATRALVTWLVCIGTYEVAPMLAAASRVSADEARSRSLDWVVYPLSLAVAAAAYVWGPRASGWMVSPWIAFALFAPLTAVRCGPRREAHLPANRSGAPWGLALVTWGLVAILVFGEPRLLRAATHVWRHGVEPAEGVLWAFPAVSLALSLVAAAILLWRALRARRAASGIVVEVGDGGLTLEGPGSDEPSWVAIESGPLPARGQAVTLLGIRARPADAGPFRDGALRSSARRAWTGTPVQLSRTLARRAAEWMIWAAVSSAGVWLRMR